MGSSITLALQLWRSTNIIGENTQDAWFSVRWLCCVYVVLLQLLQFVRSELYEEGAVIARAWENADRIFIVVGATFSCFNAFDFASLIAHNFHFTVPCVLMHRKADSGPNRFLEESAYVSLAPIKRWPALALGTLQAHQCPLLHIVAEISGLPLEVTAATHNRRRGWVVQFRFSLYFCIQTNVVN